MNEEYKKKAVKQIEDYIAYVSDFIKFNGGHLKYGEMNTFSSHIGGMLSLARNLDLISEQELNDLFTKFEKARNVKGDM